MPANANHSTVSVLATATTVCRAFNITVTAFDQYGNIATAYQGSVTITSSDPGDADPINSYQFTTVPGRTTACTRSASCWQRAAVKL